MGVRWDARVNGYIPFGKKDSPLYDMKTLSNSIKEGKIQFAMSGVDAEAAYHILKNRNIDFYIALGPYYYNYEAENAFGGRVRLFAQIYKYVTLELINTYDNRFHENIQGSISLNIPIGPKARLSEKSRLMHCKNKASIGQRLVENVMRQEIIVLDDESTKEESSL